MSSAERSIYVSHKRVWRSEENFEVVWWKSQLFAGMNCTRGIKAEGMDIKTLDLKQMDMDVHLYFGHKASIS